MKGSSSKRSGNKFPPLFLLPLLLATFSLLPFQSEVYAKDAPPRITLQSTGGEVSGSPIHLRLHILPAPTRSHPLHLHLYVDGRMVLMTTATAPSLSVSLPSLAPGRHEVSVVKADPLTHREDGQMSGMTMGDKEMGGMEGMDMGGMGSMSSGEAPRGALGHLTLVVTKKKN